MEKPATASGRLLTDTHAHICDAGFDPDRADVLDRAGRCGIGAVVAVGENLQDARKNLRLAEQFPMIRPAAGLYPTRLDMTEAAEMAAFIREHRHRLWAIGEVGLDFWIVKDRDDRTLQREIFARFIRLSLDLDLPLNVHSRSAGRHAIDMLVDGGARRVQLHAFDGKFSTARAAVDAGYYFSVPPSTVRSRQKQKLVSHLPLECLLVETDSPVLGPEAKIRNEPANLSIAVGAIAAVKGIDAADVTAAVAENTRNLYGRIYG